MNPKTTVDNGALITALAAFRRRKGLHYVVVASTTIVLLFLYYGYMSAIPTDTGSSWDWFWTLFFFEFRNGLLGLMMVVPIVYSAIAFEWDRAPVFVVGILLTIAPYILHFAYIPYVGLTSFAVLIIPPVLVMSIELKLISDAKERAAREEKIRQRAEFIKQLLRAEEEERRRISLELHDGVAQPLLFMATVAHNLLESETIADRADRRDLETVKKSSLALVEEVRAICQDLRPSILDNVGLVSATRWLADNFRADAGVGVEFKLIGESYELDPEQSVAVFRVVQEALSNVKKHAEASLVRVVMTFAGEGMTIAVDDNGKGFEAAEGVRLLPLSGRLGLLGMNERVQAIGGRLEIRSDKGLGTHVTVAVDRKVGRDLAPEVRGRRLLGMDGA